MSPLLPRGPSLAVWDSPLTGLGERAVEYSEYQLGCPALHRAPLDEAGVTDPHGKDTEIEAQRG